MIDQLKESFKSFESQLNGAGKGKWHQMRKEAFNAFEFNGFPKAKDEEYRYTHVGRVLEKSIDFSSISPIAGQYTNGKKQLFYDADAIHIFVNNGAIDTDKLGLIKQSGIDFLTLKEASEQYADDVEAHLGKYADVKKDAFTALNTAFSYEGIFIKIHKNAIIEQPIMIHYSSDDSSKSKVLQSRNLILIEQGAQANIIESFTSDHSSNQFSNHVSEIVVAANAHLKYFKFQNQNNQTYHIDNSYISQEQNSVVKSYTFTLEGKIIRNNLNCALEGEHSEAHMFGLYVIHDDGHVDNHTSVDHKVANCYSNEIYKGILDDTSKGVFNGKIFVRPDAQKTNAFQSNKNILLTDTASINTKPQLEIWADDVSCSHGCTTGQLEVQL